MASLHWLATPEQKHFSSTASTATKLPDANAAKSSNGVRLSAPHMLNLTITHVCSSFKVSPYVLQEATSFTVTPTKFDKRLGSGVFGVRRKAQGH